MATKAFQVSTSIVSAELGGEAVLLDVETGQYFGLDETGTAIWHLLIEGLDAQQIHDRLLAQYDVDTAQLRNDVADFLSHLEANALITAGSN